jgi:uroporphyrinogen-III synthase
MTDPPSAAATAPTTLAGATLVVTRPPASAGALAARVRTRGGVPLRLPGLSLRVAPDADAARAALASLQTADDCIFTSPAAVLHAFRLDPALRLPRGARAFGVGAGTQRALARRGIAALAPSARSDSEGLLALADLADVRGRRIALLGAPGGRGLIAVTLRQRGADVCAIDVYERVPPRLGKRHFDALARAADPLVLLVSSGDALANLVALLPAALLARVRHQPFVASSARLAGLARAAGFEDVREATSALPDDLLDAAGKALARHRL